MYFVAFFFPPRASCVFHMLCATRCAKQQFASVCSTLIGSPIILFSCVQRCKSDCILFSCVQRWTQENNTRTRDCLPRQFLRSQPTCSCLVHLSRSAFVYSITLTPKRACSAFIMVGRCCRGAAAIWGAGRDERRRWCDRVGRRLCATVPDECRAARRRTPSYRPSPWPHRPPYRLRRYLRSSTGTAAAAAAGADSRTS
eukprot:SAG31_NODE_278_length_18608_cov_10.304284_8_plen_199_part_00